MKASPIPPNDAENRGTPSRAAPKASFRWWPGPLIGLLAIPVWVWIWVIEDVPRQKRNIHTAQLIFWIILLSLVWIVLLSRLRWKRRLLIAGAVLFGLALPCALLEIRGVTGDLLPVLAWRWSPRHEVERPSPIQTALPTVQPHTTEVSFPQILGPNRNGVLNSPQLDPDWESHPPRQLWRQPVGPAWSGFAIAQNRALTMEQRGEEEHVTCYDLLSGQLLWSHASPAHYRTIIAGEGPRSVPTIAGNRVLTVGATGILSCLALNDGTLIWIKNIVEENDSKVPDWGVSGSPLVLGSMVIVNPGGKANQSLVAYDLESGDRLWHAGTNSAHYSSPVAFTLHNTAQVIIFNSGGITGHRSDTGQMLWQHPWRKGHPHIAIPLLVPGNRLLASSGYGTGSELLQVNPPDNDCWSVDRIWKSNRLKSKFANLILHQGHIYGLDDGILVCLDLESGELRWKDGRYGHGQMILVNDLLLLMAETGELVLVKPSPEAKLELARIPVFEDKTWNPPALAGPYLVVRNDKEAACYQLPVLPPNTKHDP